MRYPLAIALALCLAAASTGDEKPMGDMELFAASEIVWGPGPLSLQKGAAMVVLEGDPAKEGVFTMRLKMPNKSKVLRASRSIRVTVTTSPGARALSSSRQSLCAPVTFSR